jgi:hypothetical protein
LIGGGGGGPGGGGGGPGWSVAGFTMALGISTWARKMFRPAPAYLVSSLALSQSNLSVGSSERGAAAFLPAAGALGTTDGAVAAVDGAAAVELPDNIHRPTNTSANTPRTMARISLFRFSAPTCT